MGIISRVKNRGDFPQFSKTFESVELFLEIVCF